jgi:NAD+ diphosphatase
VVREVAEETGVAVHRVRYQSSQPWPFPSSVMIGFEARAEAGSPVRVSGELEDARWFTREQVRSGEALAPPTQSISWRLIETWLQGGG